MPDVAKGIENYLAKQESIHEKAFRQVLTCWRYEKTLDEHESMAVVTGDLADDVGTIILRRLAKFLEMPVYVIGKTEHHGSSRLFLHKT